MLHTSTIDSGQWTILLPFIVSFEGGESRNEQQTQSVASDGIICKLNCRAIIIVVVNPRGCLYDDQVRMPTNACEVNDP